LLHCHYISPTPPLLILYHNFNFFLIILLRIHYLLLLHFLKTSTPDLTYSDLIQLFHPHMPGSVTFLSSP
jgi:hypothetical protein